MLTTVLWLQTLTSPHYCLIWEKTGEIKPCPCCEGGADELWTVERKTDGDQWCCKAKLKGRFRALLVCHYASTSAKLRSHWRCRGIKGSPEERETRRAEEWRSEDEGFLMCVKAQTIMAFIITHSQSICPLVYEERPLLWMKKVRSESFESISESLIQSLFDFRKPFAPIIDLI